MMSKLADLKKVVRHTGHYLTRFMIVIISVGKLLQMIEHFPSHLRLHLNTHNVSLILDEIIEKQTDNVQSEKKDSSADDELRVSAARGELIYHASGDDGIEDSDH